MRKAQRIEHRCSLIALFQVDKIAYAEIPYWNLFGGGYREKAFGLLHSLAKSPA